MKYSLRATVIVLWSIAISCSAPDPEINELIQDYVKAAKTHQSISYEIDYRMKYFSNPMDTNKMTAAVDLVRLPDDTLFGGMIWLEGDSAVRYYDGRNVYIFNERTGIITQYPPGLAWPIEGNWSSDCKKVYFLKPEKLLKFIEDTSYTFSLKSDQDKGSDTWLLNATIPADDMLSGGWKKIWINKNQAVVGHTESSYDMQGENQYRLRSLAQVQFDEVDSTDLARRFLRLQEKHTTEVYIPIEHDAVKLLAVGDSFPNLKGWSYNWKDTLDLKRIVSRVVIVDFWYMDCFPCIKAIPKLNDLSKKYSEEQLMVIGVNPFNKNEKDLGRMPNFLEHNPIGYPFVFIDRNEAAEYQVTAYPSFYVLNRDREVVHSSVGFSEAMEVELDSVINFQLNSRLNSHLQGL